MIAEGKPIVSAKTVCDSVTDSTGIVVNQRRVRYLLKKEMRLSFIKTKKLHPNANSASVLV